MIILYKNKPHIVWRLPFSYTSHVHTNAHINSHIDDFIKRPSCAWMSVSRKT